MKKFNKENFNIEEALNELMIEKHHAVEYHGQSKEEIAETHLKNRELVDV